MLAELGGGEICSTISLADTVFVPAHRGQILHLHFKQATSTNCNMKHVIIASSKILFIHTASNVNPPGRQKAGVASISLLLPKADCLFYCDSQLLRQGFVSLVLWKVEAVEASMRLRQRGVFA